MTSVTYVEGAFSGMQFVNSVIGLVFVYFVLVPIQDKWSVGACLIAIVLSILSLRIWTYTAIVSLFAVISSGLMFFFLGYTDPYFSIILNKPDNFPIVLMIYSMLFVIWYAMKKAYTNDARISEGKKANEYHDPEDKVLVWPDLVYIEFIALLIFMAFLPIKMAEMAENG